MYKKGLKKLMSCFLSAVTVCTLLSGISLPTYAADDTKETVFEDNFEGETSSTGNYQITQGKVKDSDGTTDVQTDKSMVKEEGESNKALRLFSNSSAMFNFSKNFNKDDGVLHIQFDMKAAQYVPEMLQFKFYSESNKDYVFIKLGDNKLNPPAADGSWKGDVSSGKGITGYSKRTYNAETDEYKNSDGTISYGEVYINGIKTTDSTKYEQANVYNNVDVYVDLKSGIVGYNINGQSFVKKISDFYDWKANNKPELTQIKSFSLTSHKRDNGTDLYYGDIYYDNVKAEIIKNKSLDEVMFTGVYDIPSFVDFDGFDTGKDGMVNFPEGSSNIAHNGTLDLSFNQTYNTGRLYIGFDIGDTKDMEEDSGSDTWKIKNTIRYFSVKGTDGKYTNIAGVLGTSVGLQNPTSWQTNIGQVTIDRAKDKSNRVDLILDFDKGLISGYLNGVKLKAEQSMIKGSARDLSVLLNGVNGFKVQQDREPEGTFTVDNFKITHFDEGFTAVPTVNAGGKTVDIEFGTSLTDAEMTALTGAENASKWMVDNGVTVDKAEKITQSRIRLTVSNIADNTVYTLNVPKIADSDGDELRISGVADKRLNADVIKYSASKNIKNITLTGVDGGEMFLSNAEPGAKKITVDADFTPTSITLKNGDTTIGEASNGNTLTLDNFLTTGNYTLSIDGFEYNFTVNDGSYTVSSYGFTDEGGNALTDEASMLNGGSYKFIVSAKNTTGVSTKSSYAIVAYYGENNKMLGVKKTEVKNAEGNTDGYAMQSGEVAFTIPTGGSVKCVKAFIWDGLETIKPIVKSVEIGTKN